MRKIFTMEIAMNKNESINNIDLFTDADKECMKSFSHLAEMIAGLIGPHCEVVLHSFEDHNVSVNKIINGHHTGRTVGSPITDMGLKTLQLFNKTGINNTLSYFTRNKKGELFKSATSVLFGEEGKAIGLFCVNINLSVPFNQMLETLLPDGEEPTPFTEHFGSSPAEVVMEAADKAIACVQKDVTITSKFKNKEAVNQLYCNGIFELKDAVKIVAGRLGITRYAIYKYLRELKSRPV
jgi:predicted transcriptional regulator YheO